MGNMEVRFAALASNNGNSATGFDINCSVIVINLAQHDGEYTAQLCQESFRDVLGTAATVVRAERTQPRNNKPGLIKCQLASVEEKINVLRNKKKIKDDEDLRRVFIARMRSHEERLIENNFKAILKELPNGNQYRFTGSGRLVDKRDEDGATGQGGGAGRQAGGGGGASCRRRWRYTSRRQRDYTRWRRQRSPLHSSECKPQQSATLGSRTVWDIKNRSYEYTRMGSRASSGKIANHKE